MSLKVYNGIKFKSKDITEVVAQLYALKEQAKKNANESVKKDGSRVVYTALLKTKKITHFDEIFTREFTQNDYSDMWNALVASLDARMRDRGEINFNFSVVIIPWTDGNIYGISYHDDIIENYDLLKDIADDYYYQNQTDKPESKSDEEWEQRSCIWNDIFDKYVSPNDAGPVYELVTSYDLDYDVPELALTAFKNSFIEGYKVECKFVDDNVDKKKLETLLPVLISNKDIFVSDLSWLTTPCIHIECRTEEAKNFADTFIKSERYASMFQPFDFKKTHIRKKHFENK